MGHSSNLLNDLPGMRDQTALDDLVGAIEGDLPSLLVIEMEQEIEDVSRVELRGLEGHRADQVDRPEDGDTVRDDLFPRLGQLAVASLLGCQVDDHRSG